MLDSRVSRSLWLIAAGLSASGPRLAAVEPEDILVFSRDPVMIRPRLAISETYNDNVFSQPASQSDLVTTLSPGVNLQLGKTGFNTFSLDYVLNQNFYADRSDLNAGEHHFRIATHLQGSRSVLNGSDQVQLLSSPIGLIEVFRPVSVGGPTGPGAGGEPATGGETVVLPGGGEPTGTPPVGEAVTTEERNVKRTAISDSYSVGYAIGEKAGAYLQGSHFTTDYEKGIRNLYDYNSLRATVGFGYQAFPKTGFFGEVYYGQTATTPNFAAPKNPHVSFLGGYLGARGQFTQKLTGVVRAGYENREFSDQSSAPSSPVVNASLTHRLSTKTAVSLDYARLHDVSIQYSKQSYTANTVTVQLSQALGASGKWRAGIGGGYGILEYENEAGTGTRYDRYSANFSLVYQMQRWLNASLGYGFDAIRYAGNSSASYDINRITLGLSVGY